jgi:ethanolamine permease
MLVYLYLIFAIVIAGLESFIFSQVLHGVMPRIPPLATIGVLLSVVVCINLAGFELPRGLQIAASVLAVLLIVGSCAIAFFRAKVGLVSMFQSGDVGNRLSMLPAVAGMGVFLFTGFEWVTPLGIRQKSYERRLPLSMPTAIVVLMVAYCSFVAGAASQLPPDHLQSTVIPQVPYFEALYGSWGAYIALTLSLLAIFSTFNAGILGGSQLIYLLGREGNLPKWASSVSVRTGCPIGAIFCLGILAALLSIIVMTFHLEIVSALVGSAIMCLIYAALIGSAIRLRITRPKASRPFRAWTPRSVQAALILVFLIIGVLTLFSEPASRYAACGGVVVSVGVACILAAWSVSNNKQVSAPKVRSQAV